MWTRNKESYKNHYYPDYSQHLSNLCRTRSSSFKNNFWQFDKWSLWWNLNNFWSSKVIVGVSVCTHYELIIWCTVPFSILYNIIGGVQIELYKSLTSPCESENWTLKELSVYGCGGFEYCVNLGFRIANTILDFSLFLTYAILSYDYYWCDDYHYDCYYYHRIDPCMATAR